MSDTSTIGPHTPGWAEWWAQSHIIATDEGMCPEFDRITREVGGIPRPKETDRITYDVTVRVTVDDIDKGYTANGSQLRAAIQALVSDGSHGGFMQARTEVERVTISTPAE